MKAILLSGVLLMSVLTTKIASAQTQTTVIKKHQVQQHRTTVVTHHRILTHHEVAKLNAHRKIHTAQITERDSRVARNERHVNRRDEMKTGHNMYERKHDGYTRDIY